MHADFDKDIKYFVVSQDGLGSFYDYDRALEFFSDRIGIDTAFHIGHKDGFCCCRQVCYGHDFTSRKYPCVYSHGIIEMVQEVEFVEPHADSIEFTIGRQTKNELIGRSFMVGIRGLENISERLDSFYGEGYRGFEFIKSTEKDMIKIFGASIPMYAQEVFLGTPQIVSNTFNLTHHQKGVRFSEKYPTLLNDDFGNRFLNYSIDGHHKYHILLCD